MTAQELNTYIDKVLGNSLRCLLPSYWWKRLLKLVVGYVEVVDKKLDINVNSLNNKIENLDIDVDLSDYATKTEVNEVKTEVGTFDERFVSMEKFVRRGSWISITTGDAGYAVIIADGEETRIPRNSTEDIHFIDTFNISEGRKKIIEIKAPSAFTSRMTSMEQMFYNCEQITSLDLSSFDTSNVKTMRSMFNNCNNLTSLNISSFNTSKVESMPGMFFKCEDLIFLDLGNFDTSNVRDMTEMFFYCSGLTSLNLNNFNTSNVMEMPSMFAYCSGLTYLDLSSFNTSNVMKMTSMFRDCSSLTSLDVSSFDTSNVTYMSEMFRNCNSLTSLNLSNFDTSNITAGYYDIRDMFDGCINLITLTLGPNFFKMNSLGNDVDFSSLANWSAESAISSLVTNSYDRTTNGLVNLTLKLHANTYAYLTDDHKATMTAKGYVIEVA